MDQSHVYASIIVCNWNKIKAIVAYMELLLGAHSTGPSAMRGASALLESSEPRLAGVPETDGSTNSRETQASAQGDRQSVDRADS